MRAPLAQLHSLGKIRHPAAAAVDADDVDVVVEDVRFPQGAATAAPAAAFQDLRFERRSYIRQCRD
jgi:hypothetical protein